MLVPLPIPETDRLIIIRLLEKELMSRFSADFTKFHVDIFRDNEIQVEVIRIAWIDKGVEMPKFVRQEIPLHSTWGHVGLTDETIATIMLLMG